ncbi:MAG: hypothetical protein WA927_11150, partial [Rhodococcus sp. (in: high G+C Gram-positive bacteria)]
MLRAVALVPSPPLLVPELTGAGAVEAEAVRSAALEAARMLGAVADRWLVVVAAADRQAIIEPATGGSFAGFGVDVTVALSPISSRIDSELPLAALVAGWLRGEAAPQASIEVRFLEASASTSDCLRFGCDMRAELDSTPEPWGLLVVADGATTLTAKAPGSFDERAEGVQQSIDDALSAADPDALTGLDRTECAELGVDALVVWLALAGVLGEDRPTARTLYRGAPFGVGYY